MYFYFSDFWRETENLQKRMDVHMGIRRIYASKYADYRSAIFLGVFAALLTSSSAYRMPFFNKRRAHRDFIAPAAQPRVPYNRYVMNEPAAVGGDSDNGRRDGTGRGMYGACQQDRGCSEFQHD
ncbi:hypothetical protein [Bifidobacterium myosotis]|uniref:Uncharacterized protein n=1 Tax=Bifidobacterium myosotis TaxID=1630166 RepID=A0A5M9ZQ29_9BIFI|nr:hypothetical protein [Bifidobacterium myosotis]KAA8829777.1 hypothetical protein EMO91_02105 [Bifidobacterium myosotis]